MMRIVHCMIRVSDLDRSLGFYLNLLGMRLLRKEEYPDGRFTLAFIGFGNYPESAVIELTYNWDQDDYKHGTAFGHIALEVDELETTCNNLAAAGVPILRSPGPMSFHSPNRDTAEIFAFVEDPDGYRIELLQRQTLAL